MFVCNREQIATVDFLCLHAIGLLKKELLLARMRVLDNVYIFLN